MSDLPPSRRRFPPWAPPALAGVLIVALIVLAVLLSGGGPSASTAQEAEALLQAGHFDEAEALLRSAIATDSTDADALVLLAGLALWRDDRGESEALLERAVAAVPDHPTALNNLGNLMVDAGRFEEARPLLERCVVVTADSDEHAETHALAWVSLARARQATDDLEGADEAWQRAVDLNPGNLQAYHAAGVYAMSRERWGVAIRIFEHLATRQPNRAVHHHNLAAALIGAGRDAEAIAPLGRVLELDPNDTDTLFRLADLHHGQGNLEEALTLCERLLEIEPDNERARDLMLLSRPRTIRLN
jgi:tetratricopeptide (TPR) repeat protein